MSFHSWKTTFCKSCEASNTTSFFTLVSQHTTYFIELV
jgi:TorA maturation chaperone TorD